MKFPRKLKVTVFPKYDLFVFDHSGEDGNLHLTGGFEGNLFKLIAETLKFQPEYILPPNLDYGYEQENGSWTGMFGLLQRGEVDIAMGGMFATMERSQLGHMSVPYYFEELRFVTSLPDLASKTKVLIEPFAVNVWCLLLIFLFSISIMLFSLHEKSHSFQEHTFNMFKILIQQGVEIKPTGKKSEMILQSFWAMTSKILALSYVSVLLSFLMVQKLEEVFDTTSKLTSAVLSGRYKCAVLSQATHTSILQKSPIPDFEKLGNVIVANQWTCDGTKQSVFRKTRDHFAVILPGIHIRLLLDNQFVVSKDFFFSGMVVIYTKRNFCCKQKLNAVLRKIVEMGIYNKIMDNYVYSHNTNSEDIENNLEKEQKIKSLLMDDIVGAFILLGIGLGISLLVFTLEYIIVRTNL